MKYQHRQKFVSVLCSSTSRNDRKKIRVTRQSESKKTKQKNEASLRREKSIFSFYLSRLMNKIRKQIMFMLVYHVKLNPNG